jgi:hypothetical protein
MFVRPIGAARSRYVDSRHFSAPLRTSASGQLPALRICSKCILGSGRFLITAEQAGSAGLAAPRSAIITTSPAIIWSATSRERHGAKIIAAGRMATKCSALPA